MVYLERCAPTNHRELHLWCFSVGLSGCQRLVLQSEYNHHSVSTSHNHPVDCLWRWIVVVKQTCAICARSFFDVCVGLACAAGQLNAPGWTFPFLFPLRNLFIG